MRWSERQQALLQEMGLRVWGPQEAAPAEPAAAVAAPIAVAPPAQPQAAPAPEPTPAPEPSRAPVERGRAVEPVPRVAPSAVDQADWPALREAVAACHACGLAGSRRQTVFGVGHPQAHWMIVGEAPGEQEDLQGEPFVGAAGQLLDAMLQALSLTRGEAEAARQVFIANTLKCRPPRNRNPQPEELAQCAPFLHRQIALVQPRVLLAMGRFAIQQLLGRDEPIGRLRGQVHDYRGIPVIVTYHPAYLLRQPTEKAKAWDDLLLAASVYRQGLTSGSSAAGANRPG